MEQFRDIEGVPIVSQLRSAGSFGLAGSRGLVDDVARGMVLQLVGLHSPAEVVLTAITSAQSRERWELAAVASARRLRPQPAQPATTSPPAPPAAPPCCPGWKT